MRASDMALPDIHAGHGKLRQALSRRISILGGLGLLAMAVAAAASLATWSIEDPSLTYANGGVAKNALGFWGASFADLTMQFFGLAGLFAIVPIAVWGWFKTGGGTIGRLKQRCLAWIGGAVLFCASLSSIAAPATWPLPIGLGGVIGDAVLKLPSMYFGAYPGGVLSAVLAIIFAVPAFWLIGFASALLGRVEDCEPALQKPAPEIDVEERERFFARIASTVLMPLGIVTHWFFIIRAISRKWMPRRAVRGDGLDGFADDRLAGDIRVEPALDGDNHRTVFVNEGDDQGADRAPLDDEISAVQLTPSRVVATAPKPKPGTRIAREAQRSLLKPDAFELPSLHFLSEPRSLVQDPSMSTEALEQNARLLEGVLEDFGVKGQIIKVHPGPVVTLYELEPAPGIKSSRVIGLADDIARSMSAIAARVAVVSGRNAIGIELPNARRETVYLRELLASRDFEKNKAKLALCLGKTIGGEPVIADLAKMPHLLVAGTTGSGKSVAINTMILSLLFRLGPDKCKLIMIDPKMLELSVYDGIPHLLTPVVTDPKKAVVALKWTVREMEDRYKKMSKVGVRNIDGFNARVEQARKKGEVITRTVQTGFDRETGEAIYEHEELDLEAMPFIIVVIDEMADLMMVAGKDIEGTVQRLAQMARAAGIHVIMATQRPSVDVITGTIKANFPTRISFQVTSKIDSRTILGEMGAEQLLGMGDMLYMAGGGRITRVHGPFVDDPEVEEVVNHLKAQGVPHYLEAVTEESDEDSDMIGGGTESGSESSDDPYDQAVAIVLRDRKVSTSYIQRRLSIGYNRAATIIERMENEGLVGPANHAGKREILVPAEDETI